MQDRYARIFGSYDIRGVVGEDLDSPTARAIARAYGEYLCPDYAGRFVIGHDARWSSPAIAEAVSIGLRESGHQGIRSHTWAFPVPQWSTGTELKVVLTVLLP